VAISSTHQHSGVSVKLCALAHIFQHMSGRRIPRERAASGHQSRFRAADVQRDRTGCCSRY
jgi:hypothetical protein